MNNTLMTVQQLIDKLQAEIAELNTVDQDLISDLEMADTKIAELKLNIKTERNLWAELKTSIQADAIREMYEELQEAHPFQIQSKHLHFIRQYIAQLRGNKE